MGIAILDIDGTLVDTNYQHAIAWYRAFRRYDIVLPVWLIHRHIGMGGDQLVGALTDEQTEQEKGDDIRAAEKELSALSAPRLTRPAAAHRSASRHTPPRRLAPALHQAM
jgi:beta-phosphoglucomutase-like phosphatase (HAD superfamily)